MSYWKTVLSFIAIAALPAIAGASVSVSKSMPPNDDYVARDCYTPNEDVAVVTFVNKSRQQRRMSFSAKAQFSAVYLGYFTDIAIDWPRIIAIHLRRYEKDPSLVYFAVEFKPDTRIRPSPFEFGLVERACVRELEERYGTYLKFVEDGP